MISTRLFPFFSLSPVLPAVAGGKRTNPVGETITSKHQATAMNKNGNRVYHFVAHSVIRRQTMNTFCLETRINMLL